MVRMAMEYTNHLPAGGHGSHLCAQHIFRGDIKAFPLLIYYIPAVLHRKNRLDHIILAGSFAQQQAAPFMRVAGHTVGINFVQQSLR